MIQAHQYVEEQGENPNDLFLCGQDSNGTVWSICNMNMILHNIIGFKIENGDTLEDPQILENGYIRKFDRVLANPPFSQNYSRANLKFDKRFREYCPESGKKADLMFVQHMIASLKPDGSMATIMPHGVLFRGGKEKLIREFFINDDIIEAIIGLPPGLFYGTGIPACVIVVNKNKPNNLRNKILFINADREFAEGKNQNKLRPEDIEKIDFVFTHKHELPKYSRLVSKQEIVEQHDYNLNIRRYVDNTPEPESEDVQAHLIGGIPETEVNAKKLEFDKFHLKSSTFFVPERPSYLTFQPHINTKSSIKLSIESEKALQKTLENHYQVLEDWWTVARDDFALLRNSKKMPDVRQELLTTLKKKIISLGVLDEFQIAGIFVNWWQNIRYDLKTIIATDWHHTLIPDEYLITAFFQSDVTAIETLESEINEAQSELAEAIETAQELASYEPEENEIVSASAIKEFLKNLIADLNSSPSKSARKEIKALKDQEFAITSIEKRIKESKALLKKKTDEQEIKLQLKRLGSEEFKAETQEMIQQNKSQIANLDPNNDKKKITSLNKDIDTLLERITQTDKMLDSVGGQLTEDRAKELILKKLYDIINNELNRYLNAEKRKLIQVIENLWDKYAVSSQKIEKERSETLKALDGFLKGLGYLK